MGSRLIRDGMLESEAVLSLPVEARWLYVSILLSADDVGLFEATPFRLARKADIRREHAERLVGMLVDVDLIRLYQVDGKHYGFIPRFAQRLQIKRARCPLPPVSLLQGDEDAIKKINYLASIPTVDHGESPKSTDAQPPEPEPEPEVEPKKKPPRGSTERKPARVRAAAPQLVSVEAMVAEGVLKQHAEDWLAVRSRKQSPLTRTAWDQTKAEAAKAGMPVAEAVRISASEGWAGFKAAWIPLQGSRHGAAPSHHPDKVAAVAQLLGFQKPGAQGEVFDA